MRRWWVSPAVWVAVILAATVLGVLSLGGTDWLDRFGSSGDGGPAGSSSSAPTGNSEQCQIIVALIKKATAVDIRSPVAMRALAAELDRNAALFNSPEGPVSDPGIGAKLAGVAQFYRDLADLVEHPQTAKQPDAASLTGLAEAQQKACR